MRLLLVALLACAVLSASCARDAALDPSRDVSVGSRLDPNGDKAVSDGTQLDPNGRAVSNGSCIDPQGGDAVKSTSLKAQWMD